MAFKKGLISVLCLLFPLFSVFAQTEDATKLLNQNGAAVLALVVLGENKQEIARGTGFALGEEIIATCYHLVSRAVTVEGTNAKGKKIKVEGIIAFDKNSDLALLKIKGKLEPLGLGNSDELEMGKRIFSIGAAEMGAITVSEGTVRNFFEISPTQRAVDTSLAIPDSYGGAPIFDIKGQVLGVMMTMEKGLKFGFASNSLKTLPRQGKVTEFKGWTPEDYFGTLEGALFAGKLYNMIMDDSLSARNYLEKAIKLNPNLVDAQVMLASVYTKQRDYQAAVLAYQKVIELDPKRGDAYYSLGSILAKIQRSTEAIPLLEKAVEFNPTNKEIYYELGNAYEAINDFTKASETYRKYLDLKPENPWTGYFRLGFCLDKLNQFDNAAIALEEAKKVQPKDINTNYTLAQVYQKAGKLDRAEATYTELAQINPEGATTYYGNMVKMYDEAKLYDKAAEAAKKVIEVNPKSDLAVFNLGIMYQKMERHDEAIATFLKCLELKPDYSAAWYNIGLSYSKQKKYKEQVEAFKKYVELAPDSPDGWFNIGVGYMLLKNFEAALEPIKKTIELRPNYDVAMFNLAIVYLNLKDNFSAREIYKNLININPDLAAKLKKLLR